MKKRFAKFSTVTAGALMAMSIALPASADTVAEIQAQINVLMAQLSAMSGGAATGAAVQFNTNLTVGSTGADVTALQQFLVSKDFLQMPANVSYGYFGSITKSAVAAWQAANGIAPAVGYFGPISRAAIATMGGTVTIPGTTPTTPVVGITTPGAEGTITVTAGTVSNATVYGGDTMAAALAFKVRAQSSDVAIQRVKVDLGTDSNIYRRAYSRIYLVDAAGTTLASANLNADTVAKDSASPARYSITLTGFSSVVPKDTTKEFTIKVDVQDFSSTDTIVANKSWTMSFVNNSIRGIDGAGIDQYEGTNAISKTLTTAAALSDSATLTLSTGATTPLTQAVIAADGSSNNEADKVTILTFDLQAKKDAILLTDLVATVTRTNGAATASSTFLYVGDMLVGTATLSGSTATFSDIDYTIAKDTTKTFTLKADIRSASSVQTTIAASVAGTTAGLTAENTRGDILGNSLLSGSATSNSILVTNVGPVFSLVGTPTITRTTSVVGNNSTSTASATFNLRIKAVGSSILFGSLSSSTPMVSNLAGGTRSFIPYINGTAVAGAQLIVASTTDWSVPSSGVANDSGTNSFTLAQDAEITIPVTFNLQGNLLTGVAATYGSYSIGLERLNWVSASGLNASTFMAGQTNWRTSSVVLP